MMTRLTSTTLILSLLSASCSSNESSGHDAWRVQEDSAQDMVLDDGTQEDLKEESIEDQGPDFGEERPVDLSACAEDFVTGPVWQLTIDQQAAIEESMWVAGVGVRLDVFLHEDDETSRQWSELLDLFDMLDIEKLDTLDGPYIAVYGKPASILSLIEQSCSIVSFDLTGFHCDCAPEMCEEAKTCRYPINAYPIGSLTEGRLDNIQHLSAIYRDYSYRPMLSCLLDANTSSEVPFYTWADFRGVRWFYSQRRPYSWDASSCPLWNDQWMKWD